MTHARKPAPLRTAIPAAALAALLLAGCSTGHIGESWQCPLAEGGLCDSVAAADPAVPDPKAAGDTVLAEPLWRVRGGAAASPEPSCAAECDGGFDPFAWLARLFAAEAHDGDARSPGKIARASSAPAAQPPDPMAGEEADVPVEPAAALPAPGSRPGQAAGPSRDGPARDGAAAALPATAESAGGGPDDGDLRTGEVVARIWIAPFVDADGVYREASHVRVVLEPAGWRLP